MCLSKCISQNVQGGLFNCSHPISVPKRKPPISQSQPFLLTKCTERAAVIGGFLYGAEIGEGQLKKITL